MNEHKPIFHRKCGKRMPDRGEKIKAGYSLTKRDQVCTCGMEHGSVFTSRPTPPDLQLYDKRDK